MSLFCVCLEFFSLFLSLSHCFVLEHVPLHLFGINDGQIEESAVAFAIDDSVFRFFQMASYWILPILS